MIAAVSQFAMSPEARPTVDGTSPRHVSRALACQQPFNTLPKFPTDAKQDLRPNFNFCNVLVDLSLAGCDRSRTDNTIQSGPSVSTTVRIWRSTLRERPQQQRLDRSDKSSDWPSASRIPVARWQDCAPTLVRWDVQL